MYRMLNVSCIFPDTPFHLLVKLKKKKSGGERNGTPLQYMCLENPMDGGAWEATVRGIAKRWT